MGLAVSRLPDCFLPNKLHQPRHTGIQQPNINVICSIMKSTRCYTKFDNRLQSSTNAKIIRTPDTRHRPPLIWVGVLVGPHIEISVLRPLLALHCCCSNQHSRLILGEGGYFDSQTTDTQFFMPLDQSLSVHCSTTDDRSTHCGWHWQVQHGDKCQSVSCCVTSRDIGNIWPNITRLT